MRGTYGVRPRLPAPNRCCRTCSNNLLKPVQRRHAAHYLLDAYHISARHACRVIGLQCASFAYKAPGRDDTVLRQRVRELAQVRVRYGSQRLYILLRREGWLDNRKRVHRLYCLEGLNLRNRRPQRNRAAAHRLERLPLGRLHQSWSTDFVADNLFDGRKIRATGDCRRCPRKSTCIPKSKSRKITRTAYDAHYRRALVRQPSWPGRRMRRLRQRTVEPVFDSLLQHYGMRRVNTRGRSSAHKTMLLTAIAFNLKKLLKHQPKQVLRLAIALPKPTSKQQLLPFWRKALPPVVAA